MLGVSLTNKTGTKSRGVEGSKAGESLRWLSEPIMEGMRSITMEYKLRNVQRATPFVGCVLHRLVSYSPFKCTLLNEAWIGLIWKI